MRRRLQETIDALETAPLPLGRWLLLLGAIVVVRHFLEQLSGGIPTFHFLGYFLHYPLAYIAPVLGLSIVLSLMSGEKIERVTRLMLFAWSLTLLPPLVDLLRAGMTQETELIGYLFTTSGSLGGAFLNLFNPAYEGFQGTTIGIRVEAALGCFLAAAYVHLKTRNPWRTGATALAIYPTMFFFFALPSITTSIARLLGAEITNVYEMFLARADVHRAFAGITPFALSHMSISLVDLFVVAALLAVWYRLYDAAGASAVRRIIDPSRAAAPLVGALAGAALAAGLLMDAPGLLSVAHPMDVLALAGMLAAALLAGLAASILGARRERGRQFDPGDGERIEIVGIVLFSLSALFALAVSYVALTFVVAIAACYYLYETPPFRLSRFGPLGGVAIGGAVLFSVELGFAAYAGERAAIWLPKSVALLSVIVPTLLATARGACTGTPSPWSPTALLGERRGRAVAAAFVAAAFLLPGIVLRSSALGIAGATAAVAGALAVVRLDGRRVHGVLAALGIGLLIAGYAAGLTRAPILRAELASTDFANFRRAGAVYDIAGAVVTSKEEALLEAATARLNEGDLRGAVVAFRRAVGEAPRFVPAYIGLGEAYLALDWPAEAARSFRRAIALDPKSAEGHLGLGEALGRYGRTGDAIAEIEQALELGPGSPRAAYTLAVLLRTSGDLDRELEALESTVSLDPGNGVAQLRLGNIYLQRKRYDNAIAAYEAALQGRDEVEYARTRLAQALFLSGDPTAAEETLREDAALRPKAPAPRANLARLFVELGRTEEAITELETAVSLARDPEVRAGLERELSALADRD